MAPLIRDLKADMEAKANYLRYLKISAKRINPCFCHNTQTVHTYCMTARIIRDERIYCKKCGASYNLFVKEEKMCSARLIALLTKYFLFLLAMLAAAALFLIVDAWLKTKQAEEEPDVAIKRMKEL